MALTLCARSKQRSLSNPSLLRFFSSSTPTNPSPPPPPPPQKDQQQQQQQQPQSSSSFSSLYFSDVKASLKQRQQRNPQAQNQNPPGFSLPSMRSLMGPETPPSGTNRVASPEEIRNNLSGYRSRSASPSQQQQHQPISMQEVYKRNVVNRQSEGGSGGAFSSNMGGGSKPLSGKLSFDVIRNSLRQMKANTAEGDRKSRDGNNASSFSPFRTSFQPKRSEGGNEGVKSNVIGGSEGLPVSLFGKETSETEERKRTTSTEFWRMYTHLELGEKLRALRPEVKEGDKKGSFSLEELNERLRRLREMEEKETESRISGVTFKVLRESLVKMQNSDDEKAKKNSFHRWNVMGALGATPDFMLQPPKENLVEKYFHPDNMSSAENMKVELAKVREEFKMSESDCGSARVQVAQLTTKIKHLSSVLHKKDKHSRKGLQAMVQKRKKLLKYLRRTDWDSYCFVLSKLGLRDNPEYKN